MGSADDEQSFMMWLLNLKLMPWAFGWRLRMSEINDVGHFPISKFLWTMDQVDYWTLSPELERKG